ncbi:MAG: response regulator transcription factor [Myxococcota bacterium]|nr:response regulator transcription factor [Myxococcota bacterium]
MFRLGLRVVLQRESDLEIVGEATNAADALLLAAQVMVDVALVDLSLPVIDGVALTSLLREANPDCHVLGLSAIEEPLQIAQMLHAGADGYFFKTQDMAELPAAIRLVQGGVRYLPSSVTPEQVSACQSIDVLSAREREVLEHLIEGRSNDEIASTLFVARRTVETHRQRIMKKLGAHTIADLVHIASRLGVANR